MSKKYDKITVKIPTKFIWFFIISLIIYIMATYYRVYQADRLIDNRDNNRNFVIELGKELKNKAGVIVKNNNFDPILPNTLLRILLRKTGDSILSYEYDKRLIIKTSGNNKIIDIRDIVNYANVSKDGNDYIVYLN